MRHVLKRLVLGLLLIVTASAILLISDWKHRTSRPSDLPRVALFQFATRPLLDECVKGVVDGLQSEGFVDGQSVQFEKFNAENDLPTANAMARAIVDQRFALVATASTPCLQTMAAANREGRVKHIFCAVTDPFGAGVGISRDDPLKHPPYLAGIGTFQPVVDTFRLAKRTNPSLTKVGEVWNPAEACSEACTVLARRVCRELGIELLEAQVDSSTGVRQAAESLIARGAQAIWIGGDNTVELATDSIVEVARQARIPVFSNSPGGIDRGLLFALGADYYEVGKAGGQLAGKVLKGLDPATVRIEDVMPRRLALNLATLKGLRGRWSIPTDVRASVADLIDESGKRVNLQAERTPHAIPGRNYRVGLVYFGPDPGTEAGIHGLIDGLAKLGFEQGKNLEVLRTHAQGEIANIPQLLQNFDNQKLDLIVPLTTPCLAASLTSVRHTPLVFTVVYDPIAAGAGTSYEKHLPIVTGVGSFPPVEDTFETIRRISPNATVIGTLYNPSEANSVKVVGKAREVVKAMGLRLEEVPINNSSEAHQAAQVLVSRGARVFWITGDNTALQAFSAIAKVAQDNRIPLVNNDIDFLGQGALVSVGIGFYEAGLAASEMAARVLNGESPAAIPMADIAIVKRGVNFQVAKRIVRTIPTAIIDSAVSFAHLDERFSRPARIAWISGKDKEADRRARDRLVADLKDAGLTQHADFELIPLMKGSSLTPDLAVGLETDDPWVKENKLPCVRVSAESVAGSALSVARILAGGSATASPPPTAVSAESRAPRGPLTKVWNIHFVNYVEAAHVEEAHAGFFEEFRRLGMVEGRDYRIRTSSAQGDMATLIALIDNAVTDRADLLLLTSTPTLQAALYRVKGTPIVFTNVANPVLVGAGKSFEQHLPNVTGISSMSDFDGMMRVLKECLPRARTVGTLFVPSEVNSVCYKDALDKAAAKAGLKLIAMPVFTPAEVPTAAAALSMRDIDAFCQISDNLCDAAFPGIAQVAQRDKKPLFSFVSSLAVKQGAAVAVARDYHQGGRDMAARAIAIMKGKPAKDMPFTLISRTTITINVKNAQACGLEVPQSLLKKADKVVQ
jgi:ABC-type uncharacterized transport system substrate-binding protein